MSLIILTFNTFNKKQKIISIMKVTFGEEYQNLFKEVTSKVNPKISLFERYSRTSLDDYVQFQSKEFFHKYEPGRPEQADHYNRTVKPSSYVLYGQKKYKSMQMTFVNFKNARYQIRKQLDEIQNQTDLNQTKQIKSSRSQKKDKSKCNINQIVFPFLSVKKSSKTKAKKVTNISDFVHDNLNINSGGKAGQRKNSILGGALSTIVKFTKQEIDAYNKKFNFDKKEEYLQKLANINLINSKDRLSQSISVNNKKINKSDYNMYQNLKKNNQSHNFKIQAWKPQPTQNQIDDMPTIH